MLECGENRRFGIFSLFSSDRNKARGSRTKQEKYQSGDSRRTPNSRGTPTWLTRLALPRLDATIPPLELSEEVRRWPTKHDPETPLDYSDVATRVHELVSGPGNPHVREREVHAPVAVHVRGRDAARHHRLVDADLAVTLW